MKKAIFVLSIVFLLILEISCNKDISETNNEITYPDSVYFGKNILSLPDSATLISEKNYGFAANLGNDAELKVIINNLSYDDSINFSNKYSIWWINTSKNVGWTYFDYDTTNNSQKFVATTTGNIDLEIMFDSQGQCSIDCYENSADSITITKYLKWE
ncbi:MAG: hypothetical protein KAT68_08040 [Bacteroidales bacterium]|nr:hypothetical protein [Bacteroidales bacterium]